MVLGRDDPEPFSFQGNRSHSGFYYLKRGATGVYVNNHLSKVLQRES